MHVSTCFRWQAHTGMHKHAICKSICFKEAKRRNVVEIEVTQLNLKKIVFSIHVLKDKEVANL